MTIEYEFVNVDTNLATQVFVTNGRATQPVQNCDGTPATEGGFYYTPWQFLNASQGAREYFSFSEGMAIVARVAGTSAPLAPSPLTPVFPGRRYLAFPGQATMQVADLGEADSDAVAVVAAPTCVNPHALAIDWYLGSARVGLTEPLQPVTTAQFQAGETLLFQPASPENPPQRFTPAELAGAVRYRAPSYALRVKTTFSRQPGSGPSYNFSPHSAAT